MGREIARQLEQAQTEFRAAQAARENGDFARARRRLLLAAEQLFQAAQISPASLKAARTRLAQQLLAEAQALPRQALPLQAAPHQPAVTLPAAPRTSPAGMPGRASQAAGEDEGARGWLVQERPQVRFDSVAGLEEVKEEIRLKLLHPFTHPELAAQYGITPGGGVLLYGPPGTGKTLLARAVAGEIEAAFFAIKPSEIMSQWVGVAEQNVARLFAEAGRYPLSVIFIDELEALAPRRRSNQSTVMARVVPQVLAELDGFDKNANPRLLIGATNEPWSIDGALLRPGRLDRLIYVPPPDMPARRVILELNLGPAPRDPELDVWALAERTAGFSGADMAALARRARERVFSEAIRDGEPRPLRIADFEAVLAEMRPSIAAQDLRLFEKFAEEGAR